MKLRSALFSCIIIFLALLPIALTEYQKSHTQKNSKHLRSYYDSPNFSLIDSNGKAFSHENLRSRIWAVNFFFTSCTGPCPITSANLAKIYRSFQDEQRLHFVSISVDPANDTADALNKYAEKLNADTNKWHFLTGDKSHIYSLLNTGFKVGSAEDPIYHSTSVVLIDETGVIRGYYSGIREKDMKQLSEDISHLLTENP